MSDWVYCIKASLTAVFGIVIMQACSTGVDGRTSGGGGSCACVLSLCGGVCTDTSSDPANCGACGVTCAGGDACVASQCSTVLASGQLSPYALAVDATYVYWANRDGGTIMKKPK